MSNALGTLGFLFIVVAIFGLVGIWWALLALGCVLLLSAYALHKQTKPLASSTVGVETKGR
jgi:uncharacterized membrane protein YbaN (DUF454 family)